VKVGIINIKEIEPGERFRKDYGNITELAESLKSEGIIQPLAVMWRGDDKPYLLLAGGRRFKAAEQAGIEMIPVRIYDKELTLAEQRIIELTENAVRKDLDWKERAQLSKEIDSLHKAEYGEKKSTNPDAAGWSQRDTAKFLGRAVGAVSQDIRLAEILAVMPELGECKDRGEALKRIDNVMRDMTMKDLARQIAEQKAVTPEEVAKAELINSFIIKDFFDGIREVPTGSVDLVELDPPYAVALHSLKKSADGLAMQMDGYNEVPEDQYPAFLDRVFKEAFRILKPTGWLIAWFGPEPWFEIVYNLIRRHNFECRRIPALWIKSAGQTMQPDIYLASTYEMFFYARKQAAVIEKRGRANTFLYPPVPPQRKNHPTERPIEMIQDILSTFTKPNSVIAVPFLGSGNTILAASNLDMRAFGYELTQAYKDRFAVRVDQGELGSYNSYVH
jgi:DNA modification methylase